VRGSQEIRSVNDPHGVAAMNQETTVRLAIEVRARILIAQLQRVGADMHDQVKATVLVHVGCR